MINEDTKAVLLMMVPMILGSSAGQINVLVNTNFATSLESGAVSWLGLSFRILQLPIGLFGVAIASVILPSLTKKIAVTGTMSSTEVGKEFQNAVELVIWLMAPCMIGIMFAGEDIISLLLRGGKFDSYAVEMTGKALSAYGIGVIGYGLIKVLTNYFYATERTKYPMKVSFISIFLNFTINFYLVSKFGHVGLAYTAASIFCLNALMLAWGVRKDGLALDSNKFFKSMLAAALAAILSGSACLVFNHFYAESQLLAVIQQIFGEGAVGGKTISLVGLGVKGLIVAIIFIPAALIYLQLKPAELISLAKQKLKSRRT